MTRRAIVLGSTGSIGRNALDVLSGMRDEWSVVGLAGGRRAAELAAQADACGATHVAIADAGGRAALADALGRRAVVFAGQDALVRLVDSVECDCVICAVVGADGLPATLRAIELGRRVALANKEAMVVAGSVLMPLAARTGALVIPIDSEHSGVFQALHAGRDEDVCRVYLTASGSPFRTATAEAMEAATVRDALNHPTWDMGPKITIDSATMMNKALEIVEAKWLFGINPAKIDVVVHPESIIHAIVEFCDGSMVAQMGAPDMRTPIQYALTHPDRRTCPATPLDLKRLLCLTLEPPDEERFPAIRLGHEVAERGGTAGAVLNAANETAVSLFRRGAIGFCDIARYTERVLAEHKLVAAPGLDDLMAADRWARQEIGRCVAC